MALKAKKARELNDERGGEVESMEAEEKRGKEDFCVYLCIWTIITTNIHEWAGFVSVCFYVERK